MVLNYKTEIWILTSIFFVCAFILDLYLEKKYKLAEHSLNFKNALSISIGWILAALLFNFLLWIYFKINFNQNLADQKALEFLTGYLLEKSLSLDNLFIFIMIFKYLYIPSIYQKKILTYGILSAIFLRFLMIFFGIWLIKKIHWILYVFGGLLIISGFKILLLNIFHKRSGSTLDQLNNNKFILACKKILRITEEISGDQFFIRKDHKIYITPLLLALILIEFTDLVFAIDSIPAILLILNDPFIIFTSNIFAILGLRALYFLLVTSAQQFNYLQHGIAIILIYIGSKMLLELKIPIIITLAFIITVITTCIGISIYKKNSNTVT